MCWVRCDWAWRVACSTAATTPGSGRVHQIISVIMTPQTPAHHTTCHRACSPCRMSVMLSAGAGKKRTRNRNGNHVEQSEHIFVTQGGCCYMTAGGWLANSQASRGFFRCEVSHRHWSEVCTDRPSVGWVQPRRGYKLNCLE